MNQFPVGLLDLNKKNGNESVSNKVEMKILQTIWKRLSILVLPTCLGEVVAKSDTNRNNESIQTYELIKNSHLNRLNGTTLQKSLVDSPHLPQEASVLEGCLWEHRNSKSASNSA